jgi:glycosyltransferase involved in cell wall biosynthesis
MHDNVDSNEFDQLIVHQSHWNGSELTFGNQALTKTSLWFHNATVWSFLDNFWRKGGDKAIFPTLDCVNIYRAIPQWSKKAIVLYNSYCPIFQPNDDVFLGNRLLFIGAVTPTKGFREVMQLWSYLAENNVELEFAIAGSISLHKSSINSTGSMGIGELDFENNEIKPWLKNLPESHQPTFLGSLSPRELHKEILKSWAVLVNPSWQASETFCVGAVEAQSCDRTVFSIALGGLKETVYQGKFQSLSKSQSIQDLGDLITNGLANPDVIANNSKLAGEYVRNKFESTKITENWINLINGKATEPTINSNWNNPRDFAYDLMRWTGIGILIKYVYSKFLNRPF